MHWAMSVCTELQKTHTHTVCNCGNTSALVTLSITFSHPKKAIGLDTLVALCEYSNRRHQALPCATLIEYSPRARRDSCNGSLS
eukprot:m.20132 g.20132  ORF g.20132 m.20132 type:complete len:84 (-) comp8121_c0_seq2:1355-1606(-)